MTEIYGAPPVDLGLIDLSPREMMFWLYCPIKVPGDWAVTVPQNLRQFMPIIAAVSADCSINRWRDSYVYLTAKRLHISPENPGNRPGWHSDGFLTDDLNYIWSDSNPTLFWVSEKLVSFTQDHQVSLGEMASVEADREAHCIFPDRHLLRLDQTVIHRVADVLAPGIRTFVKVSVSSDKYDLIGNSVNHLLDTGFAYSEREQGRNMPARNETRSSVASPSQGEPA